MDPLTRGFIHNSPNLSCPGGDFWIFPANFEAQVQSLTNSSFFLLSLVEILTGNFPKSQILPTLFGSFKSLLGIFEFFPPNLKRNEIENSPNQIIFSQVRWEFFPTIFKNQNSPNTLVLFKPRRGFFPPNLNRNFAKLDYIIFVFFFSLNKWFHRNIFSSASMRVRGLRRVFKLLARTLWRCVTWILNTSARACYVQCVVIHNLFIKHIHSRRRPRVITDSRCNRFGCW